MTSTRDRLLQARQTVAADRQAQRQLDRRELIAGMPLVDVTNGEELHVEDL